MLLPEAHETEADGPEDEILTQKARADLVVSEGPLDFDSGQLHPKFFIEVKRASAPKSQIDSPGSAGRVDRPGICEARSRILFIPFEQCLSSSGAIYGT